MFASSVPSTGGQPLPIKKKDKKTVLAEHPEIILARKKVNTAFDAYSQRPTRSTQQKLQKEKMKLRQIYDQLTEQDLQSEIEDIENTNQQHRHAK